MQKILLIVLSAAAIGLLAGCANSYPGGSGPSGVSTTIDPWGNPLMIQKKMSRVTRSLTP